MRVMIPEIAVRENESGENVKAKVHRKQVGDQQVPDAEGTD